MRNGQPGELSSHRALTSGASVSRWSVLVAPARDRRRSGTPCRSGRGYGLPVPGRSAKPWGHSGGLPRCPRRARPGAGALVPRHGRAALSASRATPRADTQMRAGRRLPIYGSWAPSYEQNERPRSTSLRHRSTPTQSDPAGEDPPLDLGPDRQGRRGSPFLEHGPVRRGSTTAIRHGSLFPILSSQPRRA